MKRRGFLASILAAGVAPAAIGSGVLMPIRKILAPHALVTAEIVERWEERYMRMTLPAKIRSGMHPVIDCGQIADWYEMTLGFKR